MRRLQRLRACSDAQQKLRSVVFYGVVLVALLKWSNMVNMKTKRVEIDSATLSLERL